MNPLSPPPQCPASSMQPWARTPIGPLIWTPVWRLGCVNVYIFIDGGVVLLLIDYCLFVTSSLLRDPPGCLGHISPTSIRLFFFKEPFKFCQCWYHSCPFVVVFVWQRWNAVYECFEFTFAFPGMVISLQDKPNVLKKTLSFPNIHSSNFKASFQEKTVDMFLKGRVTWTACSTRDHLNQVGFRKPQNEGGKNKHWTSRNFVTSQFWTENRTISP